MRGARWWVAVGLVWMVLIAVTVVSLVVWPSAATGAGTVGAVVIIPMIGVVSWARTRVQRSRTLADRLVVQLPVPAELLVEGLVLIDGELPRVGQLSLGELGVKDPIVVDDLTAPIDYLPRDVDADLARLVKAGGLVVVQGPAGAGKSRAAVAALGELPGRLLLVPSEPEA